MLIASIGFNLVQIGPIKSILAPVQFVPNGDEWIQTGPNLSKLVIVGANL